MHYLSRGQESSCDVPLHLDEVARHLQLPRCGPIHGTYGFKSATKQHSRAEAQLQLHSMSELLQMDRTTATVRCQWRIGLAVCATRRESASSRNRLIAFSLALKSAWVTISEEITRNSFNAAHVPSLLVPCPQPRLDTHNKNLLRFAAQIH